MPGQQKQQRQDIVGIKRIKIIPETTIKTKVDEVLFVICGNTESGSTVSQYLPRYSRPFTSFLQRQTASPTVLVRLHSPLFLQGLGLHWLLHAVPG